MVRSILYLIIYSLFVILISTLAIYTPSIFIRVYNSYNEESNLDIATDYFPIEIKIESVIAYNFPIMIRDGGGGTVVRISEETISNLKVHGLDYLKTANLTRLQSRLTEKPKRPWSVWSETPVSDIYSKNRLTGLRISLDGNKKFPSNAIYDAIKIPRSYYMHTNNESGKSNTGENIIIIPSMKIAIYFYYY